MLRKIYKQQAALVRDYCSGKLTVTNMHLHEFFKRYRDEKFDPGHIPFSKIGDWMQESYDGLDDIFAIDPLPKLLASLRGSPYSGLDNHNQGLQTYISQGISNTELGSANITEATINSTNSLPQVSGPIVSDLDGYFDFENSTTGTYHEPTNSFSELSGEMASDPLVLVSGRLRTQTTK
jgi:hypothetical protein